MPRPKAADPRVAIPVRVPKSLADAIADRCEQHGETVTAYIERCLRMQVEPRPAKVRFEKAPDLGPSTCEHPTDQRRVLPYGTFCGVDGCGVRLR